MKNTAIILVAIVIVVSGAAFFLLPMGKADGGSLKTKATVYKSMSCGCCDNYVKYLMGQGFDVTVVNTDDTSAVKNKYNIPSSMQSCHTTVISDYYIEGHMPIEAVKKLLSEKPDIDGIALPGMPSGSPGMTGPKTGLFKVYMMSGGNITEFVSS